MVLTFDFLSIILIVGFIRGSDAEQLCVSLSELVVDFDPLTPGDILTTDRLLQTSAGVGEPVADLGKEIKKSRVLVQ